MKPMKSIKPIEQTKPGQETTTETTKAEVTKTHRQSAMSFLSWWLLMLIPAVLVFGFIAPFAGNAEKFNAFFVEHAGLFLAWRILLYCISFAFAISAYRRYQKKDLPDDARRMLRIMGILFLTIVVMELPIFLNKA